MNRLTYLGIEIEVGDDGLFLVALQKVLDLAGAEEHAFTLGDLDLNRDLADFRGMMGEAAEEENAERLAGDLWNSPYPNDLLGRDFHRWHKDPEVNIPAAYEGELHEYEGYKCIWGLSTTSPAHVTLDHTGEPAYVRKDGKTRECYLDGVSDITIASYLVALRELGVVTGHSAMTTEKSGDYILNRIRAAQAERKKREREGIF
jgi:hypothetical protein